ncbi:hypothetical protein MHU86_9943 [Fragilaria crotonensis]|nr:hypothetical protein MHU86_9943 [Fragilaria crotonensis]
MDYDRVIPALSGLYDSTLSTDWASLLTRSSSEECMLDTAKSEPKFLTPIVYACLALLQQDDMVVSRSAFKALRHLISSSSLTNPQNVGAPETPWSKFVETAVMPGVRCALRNSNEQIRRHAISLIAEVSKTYANCSSENLHGDLSILGCEENPDLDFFLNILHVQSHRRSRALQRLRNSLNGLEGSGSLLSVNSLSNVILPLVTFPIYECKSSLEEGLAQESIATVGALGRHLSWSKYHAVLWTALNQFSRHPNQERLIIGMICALLDGFHFDLFVTDSTTNQETAVWRALEKRVIPKVESLMVNEKRDRFGKTTRSIRPNVVLALLKLLKKFPSDYFEKRLPRLLAIVCDSLKNRDSNVRELARKALAAMVVEMGPAYLSEVIRSIAVTLTEGYQLHVRSATLHHILFHLSKVYAPPKENLAIALDFDRCIPAMMDLIFQDMFGVASERRDDDGAPKKLVKEAAGSKYLDSVEMICQLLLFKPSANDSNLSSGGSSVHHVVKPFFEKLKDETISTKSIQKVKECLRRIITGLARNESACANDLLQFAYATIAPVVEWSMHRDPLSSGNSRMSSSKRTVVVWQPRSLAAPQNAKGAMDRKLADQAKLSAVKDGAQAPKLTGSARHAPTKHIDQINSPAGVCAIEFGLNLLLATLKCKNHPNTGDFESRLSPFLTLLTTCVCETRENVVTTLAIRCIALLLKRGVEPSPDVLKPLGAKIIDILSQGEAIIGANQEMTQTCLVALTTILKLQVADKQLDTSSRESGTQNAVLSLSEDQMIVLVSLLKESVMAFDDSNAALGTVKALLSQRFASPELYDLMETLLDLSVRSHRESFRDQCCNVVVYFLVEYPLSKKRFEQHLRQAMLNAKYEHKEGRMSAIRLIFTLLDRLPLDLIDEEVQLIFLPLVLQLVNDDSAECRESVSDCLKRLTCRISGSVAFSIYEYVLRWHKGDSGALRRASLQLFGIFAEGRKDILTQNGGTSRILGCLQASLESTDADWEEHYFALVSLEKVMNLNPSKCSDHNGLWSAVLLELSHPHLWVRMISSRIVGEQLQKHDPVDISRKDNDLSFVTERKGSLYDLASNFCSHLDEEESNMSTELSELAIKSLTWLARAMDSNPGLCYATGEAEGKQPVKWLLTRLANIARRKGTLRRKAIFKCFAALCHGGGAEMISPYLDVIIEPMHRAMIEAAGAKNHLGTEKFSSEAELAKEVLSMLEERCDADYLPALAKVKVKARERRDQRKDDLAAEKISDPAAAAKKKIEKQIAEKERRKRRVQGHRSDRGATAKRQHV